MQTSVFFDGVCNLCNRSVNFLISKDKKEVLKFASLQSDYAQNVIPKELLNRENLDTIIVYSDGQFYDRSNAVLKLCKVLGGGFYVVLIGYLIPSFYSGRLVPVYRQQPLPLVWKTISMQGALSRTERSVFGVMN